MMTRSPKGLYEFPNRDPAETQMKYLERFIASTEAWARRVLDEAAAKPKVRPGKKSIPSFHADHVHFANLIIRNSSELRAELTWAAKNSVDTLQVAFLMMRFCGAAFSGLLVEKERAQHAGLGKFAGGDKGGLESKKVTKEHREEIHRTMASTPKGQKMVAYTALARRLRLSQRTIERVAAEK